jgi:hypothetical protein
MDTNEILYFYHANFKINKHQMDKDETLDKEFAM